MEKTGCVLLLLIVYITAVSLIKAVTDNGGGGWALAGSTRSLVQKTTNSVLPKSALNVETTSGEVNNDSYVDVKAKPAVTSIIEHKIDGQKLYSFNNIRNTTETSDNRVAASHTAAHIVNATKPAASSRVGQGQPIGITDRAFGNVSITTLQPPEVGDGNKTREISTSTEVKVTPAILPGQISSGVNLSQATLTTTASTIVSNTPDWNDLTASSTTTTRVYAPVTQTAGCPEMCRCPDYQYMTQLLVPDLKKNLAQKGHNYSDEVLHYYIHHEFMSGNEDPTSYLGRLLDGMHQQMTRENYMSIILLDAARFGITVCWLPKNATFHLDAATEERLFPQVAYKLAAEKMEESSIHSATSGLGPANGSSGGDPVFSGSMLYNISFKCDRGAKIVLSRDITWTRYGRWRQSMCHVETEGELVVDGHLSLLELDVDHGNINWLFNMTNRHSGLHTATSADSGKQQSKAESEPTLANKYTYVNKGVNINDTVAIPNLPIQTFYFDIQKVTLTNITLTSEELNRVLALFQNSGSLSLTNITFTNLLSCDRLQPAPAHYREFKLTRSGLTKLMPCLLRKSLQDLDLSFNSISDITLLHFPNFMPMPSIKVLDLSENNISDVGVFTDMPNLFALFLARNRISSLYRMAFNRLPTLAYVDLSHNDLHVLEPGTFKVLFQMIELDLRYNKLDRFSRSVSPMRKYIPDINDLSLKFPYSYKCKILLNHNRFSHPPFQEDGYSPGPDMVVYASDNAYACDCQTTLFLESARMVGDNNTGRYEDLSEMSCQNPSSLRGLKLGQIAFTETCPLVIDCPPDCSCTLFNSQRKRIWVDCSTVEALSQSSTLPGTYPLHVDFQANERTAVTQPFVLKDATFFQRVVSLNVSRRGLERVPEFLCEALPEARVLDLSGNNLTRLPECLYTRPQGWPDLMMRLSENPWACDCDAVALVSWLSGLARGGKEVKDNDTKVQVDDVDDVRCGRTGQRVAEWDHSGCSIFDYLPLAAALGSILGLFLLVGPLLYVHRLKAMVTIHAVLHVRPFTRRHDFQEDDYDFEALLVHGPAQQQLRWVSDVLLPRLDATRHRLCVPERDFLPGAPIADSYATTVERAKSAVLLLYAEAARDEWWLYAFQLARALNARRPYFKLLLLLSEELDEEQLPQDVKDYLKANTYLRLEDNWFWKKFLFYLPDPPKKRVENIA